MATKMNPRIAAMMMARKPATATTMAAPPKGMKKGGMASGGSASSRADGIATKGKTKGTFVKMNKGGMSC